MTFKGCPQVWPRSCAVATRRFSCSLGLRWRFAEELSMTKRFWGAIAVLWLATTVFAAAANAQDVASMTGVVTDKSGGVVSDAHLKLMDTRTGTSYQAKSANDGSYKFPKLPPGPGYLLTVTKDGFETVTISNLYLPVATTTTQNVQLEIGSVSQTVEVKSEGSVSLNTTDSSIGN